MNFFDLSGTNEERDLLGRLWCILKIAENNQTIMATQKDIADKITALIAKTDALTLAVAAIAKTAADASPEVADAETKLETSVGKLSDAVAAAGTTLPGS